MRSIILTTARMRLTTWQPVDAEALLALHSDPEVMAFLGDGRIESVAQTQARLSGYLRDQEELGWTRWRVENLAGNMIGRVGFSPFVGIRDRRGRPHACYEME